MTEIVQTSSHQVSTYHSLEAYLANSAEKISIERRVFCHLVHEWATSDVSTGLTATDIAMRTGMKEHKSIGSALSRLKKKYPDNIGYERRVGETHGVYRYIPPLEAMLNE